MNLVIIGLGIISLAWLIQFIYMIQKKNKINFYFVLVYIIGVAVLAYNGFISGSSTMAIAELVSLIASALVFIALLVKK